MTLPVCAFVGLGANLGEPIATLRAALQDLDETLPQTRLRRASHLYRSPAWGMTDQPDFINAVAMLETRLSPRDLLARLLAVERKYGRDRVREIRWGPRTLDLDLLLHGQLVLDEPGLRLPHPHLHARGFVLVPLAEIAPETQIPGRGQVGALARAIAADGIEKIG